MRFLLSALSPITIPLFTICHTSVRQGLMEAWVFADDYASFSRVNARLLNAPSQLRHIPLRIYVPSSPSVEAGETPGAFKVVQTLVAPRTPNRKRQGVHSLREP